MPDLISWSDKLSVSVGSIDGQHQQLVKMLNDLNNAMGSGAADSIMGEILDGLISYTATHFKHEESLMQTHKYPKFAEHKKLHDDFVAKVVDTQKKFNEGQARVTIEVMMFLKNWLTTHIQRTDKELGDFLVSKSVTA
jgi:hemerythrin-like metal-binding protein